MWEQLNEISTQLVIGFATITITAVTYLNARRIARLNAYQMYLAAWQDINSTKIEQEALRQLIATDSWPEHRSDEILLEAFVNKHLNLLSLAYRASKFSAIPKKDFKSTADDIVLSLGFMLPVTKEILARAAFHPAIKREFMRAYETHYG